jgi:hypothetical protein
MEPITSSLLATYVFAASMTGTLKGRPDGTQKSEGTFSSIIDIRPEIQRTTPSGISMLEFNAPTLPGPKSALLSKLLKFMPAEYGGMQGLSTKIEDVVLAMNLVSTLPNYIPLPQLMCSEEGQIGMYWDIDDVYADLNIETDGTMSVYTRVRSTDVETYHEDVTDAKAVYEHLNPLTRLYALAA